jgi:glycyl-tRNA synthetase
MNPNIILTSDQVKNFLIHKKIIFQSDQLDGGMAGYQTYGHIGTIIKNHIINLWRKIFILSNVYEIETPIISLDKVLERSGHVSRFNDPQITESYNDEIKIYRADHFLEDALAEGKITQLEFALLDMKDMQAIKDLILSKKLLEGEIQVKNKNLMFKTESSYLRPEIAQSMFIEFEPMFQYHNKPLPFGIAQVGRSYRNEISNQMFTRLREFTQAEVEYFIDPLNKADLSALDLDKNIILVDKHSTEHLTTLNKAIIDLIISDTHIVMFLAKLEKFADIIGLKDYRFRQHRLDEMAHYASDCWDLEIKIDGNWLELAGLANRGDYDLSAHNIKPMTENTSEIEYVHKLDKTKIFKKYKKDEAMNIIKEFETKYGDSYISRIISNNLVSVDSEIVKVEKQYVKREFLPHVIEPSIGIDRVFFALMISSIRARESDINRLVLCTNKNICAYQVMIAQLSNHDDLMKVTRNIQNELEDKLRVFTDYSSTSIGKRYIRADEIGIPYTITVDFETLSDNTVTIRNRDSTLQQRIKISDIYNLII